MFGQPFVAPKSCFSATALKVFAFSPVSSCKATAAPSCYPWDRKIQSIVDPIAIESPIISYFFAVLASLCLLPERRDVNRKTPSVEVPATRTHIAVPIVGADFSRPVLSHAQNRYLDANIFLAALDVFDLDRARRAQSTSQQLFSKCPVSVFAASAMPLISAFPPISSEANVRLPHFQIRQYTIRFCTEVLQSKTELFQSPDKPGELYLQLLFSRAFFFMHEQQLKRVNLSISPPTSPLRKDRSFITLETDLEDNRQTSLHLLICRVLQPIITASVCRLALLDHFSNSMETVLPYFSASFVRVEANSEKLAQLVDAFVGADLVFPSQQQQPRVSDETMDNSPVDFRRIKALLCARELTRSDRIAASLCRSMFFLLSNKKSAGHFTMALLKLSIPLCRFDASISR